MSKTKAKNDKKPSSQLYFMPLWVGTYTVLWLVLWGILEFTGYRRYFVDPLLVIISIVSVNLINALIQKLLIKRFLKHSIRAWFRLNVIGVLISLVLFAFANYPKSNIPLATLSLFIPLALVQTVCLWQHVKSAWLWMLASVVAALSFGFLFRDYETLLASGTLSVLILGFGLVHGVIQAVVMRHLWLNTEEVEKAKQPPLMAEDADGHAAIQHLSVDDGIKDIMGEDSLSTQQTHEKALYAEEKK